MASSYTGIGTELMTTGENAGTWGTKTNENIQILEDAIRGYTTQALTSGGTVTLAYTDGEKNDVVRHAVIALTGALSGNAVVEVPNKEKVWIIDNQSTNAYTVTVRVNGQSGVTWATTDKGTKILYCNGTDVTETGIASDVFAPSSADGAALGSASAEFSDLYLADGGVMYFGNDQDVTLTHVADTALLLNSAMRLQFRDSGLYVGSNADGDLDVVSDGTAVDSINIESAGGITLDAGTAGSGVVYEDDGTEMARLYNSSSDVILETKVSDKDFSIKGNDGGSAITALSLDMSAAGAATFNDKVIATELDISGNMDIDGTSNLDAVDIDGAVQVDATITVGADDQGYDVKFFGDTASAYMLWDTSADDLVLAGAAGIDLAGDIDVDGTANLDNTDIDGTLAVDGTTISLDATTSLNIDNSNTSNGITLGTATSGVPISIGHTTSETTVNDNLTVTGDLTVNGTTTTVNSTTVTIDDPIFTLGGDTAPGSDDNKDRGIEFRYHDGSSARIGFMGYDDSAEGFSFLTAATNSSEVFSGTAAKIIAGELDISGNMDIDGTANLDAVDIDGAVQLDATFTVGADDQGYDVKLFGDTASAYMLWDTSADDLILGGAAGLIVPDGQFTLGSTAVTATAAEINLIDGGTARGTTAVADGDGLLVNDGGTMRMTNVTTLKTYFQTGTTASSIAADDIAAGDAAVTIGNGSTSADVTLDSGDDVVIDAAGGNVEFKDAGTLQLSLDMDGTAGVQIIKLGVDSDDLVFQQYDGNEVMRINDDRKLYFYDDGGEHISSDGTDFTFGSGNDINLTATTDINVPQNVGMTFGDDGEKIEGDGTDLTIASSAKLNLTATSDVHIPNNVGIIFGGDSEKIEGDGTDLTISANNLTVDAAADINIDAGGADVNFKDDGTAFLSVTNSSTDAVLTVSTQDKDFIIKGDDGGSAITALTVDMSAAGQFHFKDGTAALPILSNAGDTDTGLFFSDANTMAFSAGGTSQFTMADGVIAPVTDNDVDLGTNSLEFKDGYFDGTLYCDTLNLAGTNHTSISSGVSAGKAIAFALVFG